MSRQIDLYEHDHESLYELRQPDRNMIRCFGCKEMAWEDETESGYCPNCVKEHHAEINDDSVG